MFHSRIRKPGGGRKRLTDNPELVENAKTTIEKYKAGNPMNEDTIWIDTSVQNLASEISKLGIPCSRYLCEQFLKMFQLGKRKMAKVLTIKTVENRDEQFKNIERIKEIAIEENNPILSMDTKKKEKIGNFYRDGRCYSTEALKVNDHDFANLKSGDIVPHGLYDTRNNIGYITLSESHDTSEFACDNIKYWWEHYGKENYPNADCIYLLCDGGGSNSSRSYLFKEDLQNLVNEIGRAIKIIHYPPYTSKHNPIEHRLFPYITKGLSGTLIDGIQTVFKKIKEVKTSTGLSVDVHINTKEYKTERKYSDNFKDTNDIIYDDYLGKWNYKVIPQNRKFIF